MLKDHEVRTLRAKLASLPPANTAHKLSPELRESLVRDYIETDITITALARKYGVTPQSARYLIVSRSRQRTSGAA